MPKPLGMRKIVEMHRHLRGSRIQKTACKPSLGSADLEHADRGLYQPHTDKAMVSRTGTRQPPSCGKGPNAVGESVMTLPGKPQRDAARLMGKCHDLTCSCRAVIVVGAREARVHGEGRHARRL